METKTPKWTAIFCFRVKWCLNLRRFILQIFIVSVFQTRLMTRHCFTATETELPQSLSGIVNLIPQNWGFPKNGGNSNSRRSILHVPTHHYMYVSAVFVLRGGGLTDFAVKDLS